MQYSVVAAPASMSLPNTFATLLTTARKLGQNAYASLCSIAGPSPIHGPGLSSRFGHPLGYM